MSKPTIHDWSDLDDAEDWRSLLLGNGSSINIWPRFRYRSLFDVASTSEDFAKAARQVFDEFGTQDFEEVLRCVYTARRVQRARNMKDSAAKLASLYEVIRKGLIGAVHTTHIHWTVVEVHDVLERLGRALSGFKAVFSLNYDLLVYWSRMRYGDSADGFWGKPFDPLDTSFGKKNTDFFYLHGGLHLYRDRTGQTYKRAHETGSTILGKFEAGWQADEVPLIVTEGGHDQKLVRIRASEYLNFVFNEFRSQRGPIVVFGSSVSDLDRHIWNALDAAEHGRPVAVSVNRCDDAVKRFNEIQAAIPHAKLQLFWARTHPLGDRALRVRSLIDEGYVDPDETGK